MQMENSNINKEKIKKINDGLWTINRYEFFVEIEIINASGDGKIYFRKINENELAAIKTQIDILESIDDTARVYATFKRHLKKMEYYKQIVEYLNLQGIVKFESIKRKKFSSFKRKFNIDFEDIIENCPQTFFFSNSIKHSAFRMIGEIILSSDDSNIIYGKLIPYLRCILGSSFTLESFIASLQKFLKLQPNDVLFDACKLGYHFCNHFSNPKDTEKNTFQESSKDYTIFDSIKKLNAENSIDYIEKLTRTFSNRNLLFFKVIRPVHCYHCIISTARIIASFIGDSSFYLNEKQLIFCQNGGDFAERIDQISKASIKDSKDIGSNMTYFIVHPEMLNEKDHSLLVEFLNSRMNSLYDRNLPKVLIISSLDYRSSVTKNLRKFDDIELDISKELIEQLCELSYPDYPDGYSYQLYYSEKAGSGKTHQILEDFKDKKNCKDEEFHVLQSLFVDNNMKKFSKLKFYENKKLKYYKYVHFDLSPELFDNNYQFFDDLWTFCILHYHIDSDGINIDTPPNIFFEVPALTKKQFPDGGFINKSDFPIYVNHYHKISDKKDVDIKLPEKVKKICDVVFKEEIVNTSQLLLVALKMFYPDIEFEESNLFVPRVLGEINLFMEEFCKDLKLDDEKSIMIFLLLLRTNFNVWNMESIFTKKSQPKSFIIFTNQNLFSKKHDMNKWILLHFTSKDEENVWKTDCLKFKIGDVNESQILDNKHFRILFNDEQNVEIYSNHLNYIDDQTYFFSIIRTFFYLNNNKDTKYRKIIDGVISRVFINSNSFEKQKEILPFISQGKKFYESKDIITSISKWHKSFDTLHSIFADYQSESPYEVLLELAEGSSDYDYIKQISDITLTMSLVKIFVTMIIRLMLKQPFILEGFTGVGKTWSVALLKLLIEIAEYNDDFNYVFHQIDCHGDLQLDEILMIKEKELYEKLRVDLNHIFFFDELNTSPVSSYVINEMNSYHLKEKYKLTGNINNTFFNSSIVFIAAINPYIKVDELSRNLSLVGIKPNIPRKISKLKLCNITPKNKKNLYEITDINVRELSNSAKLIVIKSDPELFYFDDEDYNKKDVESSIYLPPDEIKTIGHIIDYYLNILIDLSDYRYIDNNLLINDKYTVIEDREKRKENLIIIEKTLKNNKDKIVKIILASLCNSFLEIRELMQLKSILSFRDVKRTMQFFLLYFQKLIKVYFKKDDKQDINNEILIDKIIPQSIVLSLMISIVFRFSNETRIETQDGNISKSHDAEEEILRRFAKFGLNLDFSEHKTYYKAGIRSALLNKLEKQKWNETIKNPGNWNQIVHSYSWMKCMKYVYKENDNFNSSLFKLNSLMIHLFAISSCYSACKHNKDLVIPCMIIGMPGTSKTLAIQLFTDYKKLKKNDFFTTTYLSTTDSKAEGLNAHYKDCAMFMMEKENNIAVCVIEELGLANLNETHSLNLLHYYFDKGIMIDSNNKTETVPVMSIVASDYAIDYENTNRGVLICTDFPTDKELAEAFYLSELESETAQKDVKHKKITKEVIIEYEKNYFDDENDFFSWKKDEKIIKFEKFLQILWNLTDNHERPDILTLRPLYFLFNAIFHNREDDFHIEVIGNLCLYLISVIACKPNESYEKLQELLTELNNQIDDKNVKEALKYVKEYKTDGFYAIKEIFGGKEESLFYTKFCEIVKKQASSSSSSSSSNEKTEKKTKTKGNKKAKTPEMESSSVEIEDSFRIINDVIMGFDGFDYMYNVLYCIKKDDALLDAIKKISNTEPVKKLTKEINNRDFDNYKMLRQSIISILQHKSKRALCFRTKNYECLDFIEDLLYEITMHYDRKEEFDEPQFTHIYPSNFKLSRKITADESIEELIDKIKEKKMIKKKKRFKKNDEIEEIEEDEEEDEEMEHLYYFLIVGNVCLTDSLLDLLNTPSEGKGYLTTKNPLISKNGFSIELDEYPSNIVFCFIMNENDFQNLNSVDSFSLPLFDRLNQLYLDYNDRDEFGIIEKYQKFNEKNSMLSTPYSTIIHDYFNRFVDNLKSVPVPQVNHEFSCVFATSDINKTSFINDVCCQEYNLNDDFDDFLDFYDDARVILITFYRKTNDLNHAYQNLKKLLSQSKIGNILTFYCSTEFDKLYRINEPYLESNQDPNIFHIPLPKPDNYCIMNNDGSINLLIDSIQKGQKEVEKEIIDDDDVDVDAFDVNKHKKVRPIRAIILTTSPMMEEIYLDKSDFGITKENTLFLFDQYISSAEDFQNKIDNAIKEKGIHKQKKTKDKTVVDAIKLNIVVQLNHFQIEHDRFLRYLLEDQDSSLVQNTFIIYHLKSGIIPEGLYSSEKWPLYWIESITDSFLSKFKTTEIVDCILFKGFYETKMKDLFTLLFNQVYADVSEHYEDLIQEDKVHQIIDFIFEILKGKKKENGQFMLESVNFSGLFDKFAGKTIKDSYKTLNFKREFCNEIARQIPFLDHLVKLLVLNCDVIKCREIDDTFSFIKALLKFNNIEELFKISDIDNRDYSQLCSGGLYFPELIFPQVLSLYEAMTENRIDSIIIDKHVFDIFKKLQINQDDDLFVVFGRNYFMCYLDDKNIYREEIFITFLDKFLELMK